MFVRNPNKNELNPARAAVAVIRDRLRSERVVSKCCRWMHEVPTLNAARILGIAGTFWIAAGGVIAYAVASCVRENTGL